MSGVGVYCLLAAALVYTGHHSDAKPCRRMRVMQGEGNPWRWAVGVCIGVAVLRQLLAAADAVTARTCVVVLQPVRPTYLHPELA